MDLKSFVSVLWRRRLVVAVTAVLALVATIGGLSLVTPEYTASTTLRMGTANTGSSGWVSYDIQYTDRLMNTYRTMVISKQTSDEVMSQLNLSVPPQISVTIPANTELMEISVQDRDPKQAADAADAVANILVSQIESQYGSLGESSLDILKQQIDQTQANLDKQRADYQKLLQESPQNTQLINATLQSIQLNESTYSSLLTQYQEMRDATAQGASKMTVVQKASIPESPSNPNKKMLIPLGFILGLIGGTGFAFLLENFDTTMHSSDEIAAATELPVLARIPHNGRTPASVLFGEKSPQEEAFRRLRTTLFALDPESKLRSLMVTSSQPAEGKSTTVANLALAIAQAGRRVLVIDGDLRRPSMHRVFRVSNALGLSTVLTGGDLDEAIQYSMIPGVHVLTSGPATPNPAELLGVPEMHQLIDKVRDQFDFVLIDAPSLQTVADAAVLSLIVDAVIVVAARGQVDRETLDAGLEELASVQRKPLGVVITHAELIADFHYDRDADRDSDPDRVAKSAAHKPSVPKLRVIPSAYKSDTTPSATAYEPLLGSTSTSSEETADQMTRPLDISRLRRPNDQARISLKNGGSIECFGNDPRAAHKR